MRWGLGPVFLYECLSGSRRWQTYAIRAAAVAVLLAAIATIAMPRTAAGPRAGWREYAALGKSYYYAIIGVEIAMVMLTAPAATAGAICVDRARGTLSHMLATDLSDAEIVLGKLAARMLPVLGLVACSWPVLAISSLLGGIDPAALTVAFAIILAVALLGCTMALALSVWARKPHEVVLVVYAFWALALLFWPIWYALAYVGVVGGAEDWALLANPYYLAYAPYSAPGRLGLGDYLSFFGVSMGASAALAGLAVWRMRPVARRGIGEGRARGPRLGLVGRLVRRLPGPSLDGNPVLWREWHRSRPSRWVMALAVLVGGSSGGVCLLAAGMAWTYGLQPGVLNSWVVAGMFGMIIHWAFGLLVLSASAPTSMSEERQRGSLDLLAVTALPTRTIVLGKWLGALRPVALLAIAPGVMGVASATAERHPWPAAMGQMPDWSGLSRVDRFVGVGVLVATILAHGALIASVGLALATWIARPSRAIALSVGFAVMIGAGWPILMAMCGMGLGGMAALSPVVAAWTVFLFLATQGFAYRSPVAWTAFWDLECLVLALGLVWLTVRTFDACFGRIPDRPRRATVLSDVVVVVAVLVGVGGLCGAFAVWAQGAWTFGLDGDPGVIMDIIVVTAGFALVSALAASSMSRGLASRVLPADLGALTIRKPFATRWWEAYRLVLLLAIGPALMATATATAPLPVQVGTWARTLPGGTVLQFETDPTGITYVRTTVGGGNQAIRVATDADMEAVGLDSPRRIRAGLLRLAAVAVFTVLVHGTAYVALGAALGVWIRRRGLAIAASVGSVLLVTVAWPIVALIAFGTESDDGAPALASLIPAYCVLVFRMYRPDAIVDMTAWVGYWNVVMILAAVIATALAIGTLDRRARKAPGAEGDTGDILVQPGAGESGRASIWERVASR